MKARPLLSFKSDGRILTPDELLGQIKDVRDITADANNRFFRPVPGGEQVILRHVCVVGKQGCGKTWMLNFMVWVAVTIYGKENCNIIYTDDPRVALELFDGRPVQIVIIDDATQNASSREIHKQIEILKSFNRSRHVYEEKNPGKAGIVFYLFGWQRWIELDPGFRDGHLLIFKTGMTGYQDRKDITDKLGESYHKVLDEIWDRIERGDNEVMKLSVARIASKRPEDGGVGLYVSDVAPWVLPKLIRSEEYFATDEATADQILEQYRNKAHWSLRIECYELSKSGKYKTQTEIAAALSKKHKKNVRQGYVCESIKRVNELLEK
jgi:hypothetical protein